MLRADPAEMRRHVFFRDQGVCAMCKKRWLYLDDAWQADHIEPLFLAFGDLAYWEPENVQVLCTDPCHKQKSADDMRKYGFVLKLTREQKKPQERRRLAERLG
ncbi:HNH endonuclease [Caulobacter virus Karma]|uniref:HNH endonuclease n=1 Tax=Caulobacter virus Karma TaxID=1211641 RepID=UPI00028B07CD|nr:HNH endonuclease [Caulobacter virus Karma]AFU87584.1 putative HNH endonuclease [Caulobacter virus Karma]